MKRFVCDVLTPYSLYIRDIGVVLRSGSRTAKLSTLALKSANTHDGYLLDRQITHNKLTDTDIKE
jgi:hypothetical protein